MVPLAAAPALRDDLIRVFASRRWWMMRFLKPSAAGLLED